MATYGGQLSRNPSSGRLDDDDKFDFYELTDQAAKWSLTQHNSWMMFQLPTRLNSSLACPLRPTICQNRECYMAALGRWLFCKRSI